MYNHSELCLGSRKGVWTDVDIPLDRFLLTWKGRLVEVSTLTTLV